MTVSLIFLCVPFILFHCHDLCFYLFIYFAGCACDFSNIQFTVPFFCMANKKYVKKTNKEYYMLLLYYYTSVSQLLPYGLLEHMFVSLFAVS